MDLLTLTFIGCIAAYLIGSIPSGVILSKLFQLGDLRDKGSGNIGATNMLRVGGKKLALLTLLLDMAKGGLPVFLFIVYVYDAPEVNPFGIYTFAVSTPIIGLFLVLGHIYSPWLLFFGGKGIATIMGFYIGWSFGMMYIFDYFFWLAVIGPLAWLAIFFLTRISAAAGLASIWAPLFIFLIEDPLNDYFAITLIIVSFAIAIIATGRHRDNIMRMMEGTEPVFELGFRVEVSKAPTKEPKKPKVKKR